MEVFEREFAMGPRNDPRIKSGDGDDRLDMACLVVDLANAPPLVARRHFRTGGEKVPLREAEGRRRQPFTTVEIGTSGSSGHLRRGF